ncbi:MAG TPA: aldo/keto reductase [Polyangiaceae bacterium]
MQPRIVQGVSVPAFMYGTAWKEERTGELVQAALGAGFRGIDTANQRRHYVEASVGEAVAEFMEGGSGSSAAPSREDLFLQTKFTHAAGQDHRIPYDPAASPGARVMQSFESSLGHLKTSYVDSYVLHGPSSRRGLGAEDLAVWRAMEQIHGEGRARLLGVSNVTLEQLEILEREAVVKPAFVQNRCFASMGWDEDVRRFCRAHSVLYQGFSLLTANARELGSPILREIVDRTQRTPAQVVFRFALDVGMIPLTGTSSLDHMKEDLGALDFELRPEDVRAVERLARS